MKMEFWRILMAPEDFNLDGNSQSIIFLESEGDNWWRRNRESEHLENSFSTDFIINRLDHYRSDIHAILEVGCSNAEKLQRLAQHFEAQSFGIDPSQLAIEDARSRFERLRLIGNFTVGLSSSLPISTESIDLVLLGFFLYLIPTDELEQTFDEANRVLKKESFMVIEDFDPGHQYTKPYSHNQKVRTYKDDFAKYLIGNYGYELIDKVNYSHSGNFFEKEPDERIATQIFYKPK
jgi:ubiquinone/menaquinone biosynthesis C-methylase UbiE